MAPTQILVDCPLVQVVLEFGLNGAVKVIEAWSSDTNDISDMRLACPGLSRH